MKYASLKDLQAAAVSGEFTGEVIVDNDNVSAYQGDEEVYDFNGRGPEGALIDALSLLGFSATGV